MPDRRRNGDGGCDRGIGLGRCGGQGDGVGLAERAAAGVGGFERGIAQRGAQLGVVAVAQPRFEGLESTSGLLVVFVGDAVQGGGDGRVAVGAGRQGQAEERAGKDTT